MEKHLKKLMTKRHRLMGDITRREDLIHGTLVETLKKCGRKTCACEKHALHPHIYLSTSIKGRTRIVYLSQQQARKIKSYLQAYREVRALLESISDINLQVLKSEEAKSRKSDASNR